MNADRIERDILIGAPVERVWPLVAEPGFWAADEANLSGAMAEEGEVTVVKHTEHGEFPVRVEKVEPPTYVAYRWVSAFPGEALREDNSTLVEFTLTAEGDKTRLRVVESGFASLNTSEDNRQNVIKDHANGWPQCLDALKTRAEQSRV
ncbi:SRPBCC domain-containing protein [Haloechinothrix sp. YIM 98757]|uniref:SRPBCC domain-containing protein n=1 Tax=Haloechinothrix aidingensis TaxID=2752311 RepID=A0A838ACY3_9PSEU|nr:SRPBCC domain-containing protein [Haloechinothrix aidingensis]